MLYSGSSALICARVCMCVYVCACVCVCACTTSKESKSAIMVGMSQGLQEKAYSVSSFTRKRPSVKKKYDCSPVHEV